MFNPRKIEKENLAEEKRLKKANEAQAVEAETQLAEEIIIEENK